MVSDHPAAVTRSDLHSGRGDDRRVFGNRSFLAGLGDSRPRIEFDVRRKWRINILPMVG